MRLKKIALKNYRCFEHLEIDLHDRLTVLVGENGSGKTAVLDAIATGLTPLLGYLSSANQRLSGPGFKDTDFRLENWVDANGKERWNASDYAQVIVKTVEGLEWDNWKPSVAGKQPATKIGRSELLTYAVSILDSFKTNNPLTLPVFAYYGAQRGRIELPERIRSTKQDYSQPTSALVDALDSRYDFKEMLKWFDAEETAELRANKDKREPEDFELSNSLETVRNAIENIFGGKYYNPYFNRDHKFVVLQDNGMPLQVSQLSQGYQSMLALGMDFARRLACGNNFLTIENLEQQPWWESFCSIKDLKLPDNWSSLALAAPAMMLIDEIDLHLHPSWQQRVIGDLMRTFPNTQFIVTTHSPQVLSTVPDECIRILTEGKILNASFGTEGAESSRLLKRVFRVDIRPPENKATKELNEYLDLIYNDQWTSLRAIELRKLLDARYQGEEPALTQADLYIENRKWELEIEKDQ